MSRVGTPPRNVEPGAAAPVWWVDGLIAASLGLAAIAATFATADVLAGRSPFHTVAVLGSVLLFGVVDASRIRVTPLPVAAYTVAHLIVFLLLGIAGAWLVDSAPARGRAWRTSLIVLVLVALHLTAAAQALTMPTRATVPAAAVWVAGIAGGVVMAGYLIWSRSRGRTSLPRH
jgi:hypothetical protein